MPPLMMVKILTCTRITVVVEVSKPCLENLLQMNLLRTEIERALETLTPREAECYSPYTFGFGSHIRMTLEEIGETFDPKPGARRQIKRKTIFRRLQSTL